MLILASASRARLELLRSVGISPDKIVHTNIDETPTKGEKPLDYVCRIAREKNNAIEKKSFEIVISADTAVSLGRRILLKPSNKEEALSFLNLLSGRRHRVHTSVCIFSDRKYYQKNGADLTLWKNYVKYNNKWLSLYPSSIWASLAVLYNISKPPYLS